MLRSETIEILQGAIDVIDTNQCDDYTKLRALRMYLDDAIEETLYGVTVERVRRDAREVAGKGKAGHVRALLRIVNAEKLDDIKDNRELLQAVLAIIKIL